MAARKTSGKKGGAKKRATKKPSKKYLKDRGLTARNEVRKNPTPEEVEENAFALRKPKNSVGRPTTYSGALPQALIDYFGAALEEIEDVFVDHTKGLRFVQKPVELPLLSGFATALGVHRDTLHEWGKKHDEFSDALKIAKDIQERILARMGSHGAYSPAWAIFALKNVSDWTDKTEVGISGGPLTLKFDEQDKDA